MVQDKETELLTAGANDAISKKLLDREALAEDVRRLSQVSNCRAVFAITVQWIVIAAMISAAVLSKNWFVYAIAVVVIASRQHALGILVHEAAHYRLFSNRRANDLLSDLLMAFPLGISTALYRRHHFAHHKLVNTNDDPDIRFVEGDEDWEWPKLQWECARLFIRDFVGLNIRLIIGLIWQWSPWPRLLTVRASKERLSPRQRVSLLAFVITALTIIALTKAWLVFLLLWVLPVLTALNAIFRACAG